MSRVVGIDLRDQKVRAVVLMTSYRKLQVEIVCEEPMAAYATPEEAVRACALRIGGLEGQRVDAVVTSIDGQKSFVHLLSLPATAEKRLDELLPFELEAQLPVDIDEVVYSHQVLPRPRGTARGLDVLTVSARTEHVRAKIDYVQACLGREPDRVGASAAELGGLAVLSSEFQSPLPVVLMDLGGTTTDLCLLQSGVVRSARTLSVGCNAFPTRATQVTAQVRQTLSGFAALSEEPVARLFLMGEGAALEGIFEFLNAQFDLEVVPLPALAIEIADEATRLALPTFAQALAAALHGVRGKGFDLRRGPLAFQRGFGYVKERAPLLLGLAAALVISFVFSTWAEGRALDNEQLVLTANLEELTKAVFSEATADPDEALALLERARKSKPEDPMPYHDGFSAMVALAETVPGGIKHDVEQFDYTKGKLKIRGLVDKTEEVQRVTKALEEHRCIQNATVTKISQVVNSERERYMLEADVRCPEDPADPKQKAAAAASATGGKP